MIWEYYELGNKTTGLRIKIQGENLFGHIANVNKKKEIANIHVMFEVQKTSLT